jgi:hypothetical protein
MGEKRGAYSVWWGDLMQKHQLECLGLDWRIILKWVVKIGLGRYELD